MYSPDELRNIWQALRNESEENEMYSGDEFYDDDITSGPADDGDEWSDHNDEAYYVPWSTYEEYIAYSESVAGHVD